MHSDEAAQRQSRRETQERKKNKNKTQADSRCERMKEGDANECVGEMERSRDVTERQVSDPLEVCVCEGGGGECIEPF